MLIFAAVVAGGCASTPIEEGPAYPADPVRGGTLGIQVFREGRSLELTNTTANDIRRTRLWINGRFSIELEPIAVGERRRISLAGLRDRHGEAFRAGGFFATERPDPVVLAELEGDGELLRLVVVRDEAD